MVSPPQQKSQYVGDTKKYIIRSGFKVQQYNLYNSIVHFNNLKGLFPKDNFKMLNLQIFSFT